MSTLFIQIFERKKKKTEISSLKTCTTYFASETWPNVGVSLPKKIFNMHFCVLYMLLKRIVWFFVPNKEEEEDAFRYTKHLFSIIYIRSLPDEKFSDLTQTHVYCETRHRQYWSKFYTIKYMYILQHIGEEMFYFTRLYHIFFFCNVIRLYVGVVMWHWQQHGIDDAILLPILLSSFFFLKCKIHVFIFKCLIFISYLIIFFFFEWRNEMILSR